MAEFINSNSAVATPPGAANQPRSSLSNGNDHFLVNVNCDAVRAFSFKIKEIPTTGYILGMKLKDTPLKADWGVRDPENPGELISVVSVLDYIGWSGKATEPVIFEGRMSFDNRSIFKDWVANEDGGADVEVNWVVKEYDVSAKQYFQAFHSEGAAIKFMRAPTPTPTMQGYSEAEPLNPVNYKFTIYLTPKTEGGEQNVGYSTSCTHKTSRKMGIQQG